MHVFSKEGRRKRALVLLITVSLVGIAFTSNPASADESRNADNAELPGELSEAKRVPSTTVELDQSSIAARRMATARNRTAKLEQVLSSVVQRAKSAGAHINRDQVTPVDMGAGLTAFENRVGLTHYESVSVAGHDGMPLHFAVETAPTGDFGHGLTLGRGPGSHSYGWTSQAELYLHWNERAEATLFTYKAKDRVIWDANTGSNKDLWGYSKKVVVTPEDGWPSQDIVKKIYLSAWPTSSSKSRITGWYDYEPFASSGGCDTLLGVGIKFVEIPLNDCESYTRWIRWRNGTDYGIGAMGVTYDQGVIVSGGQRQGGLAMAVKVKVGQHPYWNDRLSVTMWQMNFLGIVSESKTCTTYAYAGHVYCWS